MRPDAGLIDEAVRVLRGNDVGDYTKPSPRLYPHQWNWDSAFIAIGRAHVDWDRATREIDSLLRGQWTNGMLPHIRYDPRVTDYAPGPEWWPDVPTRDRSQITSGISQPPVLPSAVALIGMRQADRDARHAWWDRIYDALRDALLYFPRRRTVEGNPLIVVVHPWESGADNSPRWDFVTGGGYKPSRPYRRIDTSIVQTEARPTERDYDLYMYLVELIASHGYDLHAYLPHTPFAVYDALFNAVWYKSALDLNRIAATLGRPPAVEDAALRAFADAYHATLWEPSVAMFRDHDVRGGRRIPVDTVAGLAAIYAGLVGLVPAGKMLVRYRRRCEGFRLLPSTAPDQAGFDPIKYWRGPVWVNANWMVIRGLERLGLRDDALAIKTHTLELVRRAGCREYYHARTGDGLGGTDFSWTAALTIDLLQPPAVPA